MPVYTYKMVDQDDVLIRDLSPKDDKLKIVRERPEKTYILRTKIDGSLVLTGDDFTELLGYFSQTYELTNTAYVWILKDDNYYVKCAFDYTSAKWLMEQKQVEIKLKAIDEYFIIDKNKDFTINLFFLAPLYVKLNPGDTNFVRMYSINAIAKGFCNNFGIAYDTSLFEKYLDNEGDLFCLAYLVDVAYGDYTIGTATEINLTWSKFVSILNFMGYHYVLYNDLGTIKMAFTTFGNTVDVSDLIGFFGDIKIDFTDYLNVDWTENARVIELFLEGFKNAKINTMDYDLNVVSPAYVHQNGWRIEWDNDEESTNENEISDIFNDVDTLWGDTDLQISQKGYAIVELTLDDEEYMVKAFDNPGGFADGIKNYTWSNYATMFRGIMLANGIQSIGRLYLNSSLGYDLDNRIPDPITSGNVSRLKCSFQTPIGDVSGIDLNVLDRYKGFARRPFDDPNAYDYMKLNKLIEPLDNSAMQWEFSLRGSDQIPS